MSRKHCKSLKRRGIKKQVRSKSGGRVGPEKTAQKPTAEVKPRVTADLQSALPAETQGAANTAPPVSNGSVNTSTVSGATAASDDSYQSHGTAADELGFRWSQQRNAGPEQISGESLADRMQRLVNQDAYNSYLGPCYHMDSQSVRDRRFPTHYCGPHWSIPQDDAFPSLRREPCTGVKSHTAVGNVALIMPIDRVTQVRYLNSIRVSRELDSLVPDGIRSVRLNWRLNLLAVDTLKPEVTAALMGLRRLCGVPVEVQEPRSSFKAVGVVYGIQPGMTATGIEACVHSKVPVLSVRIPRPPSPAIITFASSRIPEYVTIGFVRHRVQLYVDRPPRCNMCGGIGHVAAVCRNPYACRRCGAAHDTSLCPAPRQRCLNCGRDHDSRSRMCPRWLQMLEVSRYRRLNDVDLQTAKEAVVAASKTPKDGDVSYSNKEAIRRLNSALADASDSRGGRMRIDVLADHVRDASRSSGKSAVRRVYTVEELLKIGSKMKEAAKGRKSGAHEQPSSLGVTGRITGPLLKAVIMVVGILGRILDDIEKACYRCLNKFQPNDVLLKEAKN